MKKSLLFLFMMAIACLACDEEESFSIEECISVGNLPNQTLELNGEIEIGASILPVYYLAVYVYTKDTTDNRGTDDYFRVVFDYNGNGEIDDSDFGFESPTRSHESLCSIDLNIGSTLSDCSNSNPDINYESSYAAHAPDFNRDYVVWSISIPVELVSDGCTVEFVIQTISNNEIQNWPRRTSSNDQLNIDLSNSYSFDLSQ